MLKKIFVQHVQHRANISHIIIHCDIGINKVKIKLQKCRQSMLNLPLHLFLFLGEQITNFTGTIVANDGNKAAYCACISL